MSARKYRKKPVEIDAVQWTGDNPNEVVSFCPEARLSGRADRCMEIPTLEGVLNASPGDYVIRGVKGEFYPCKPDVFEATYELVDGRPA